MGTSWRSNWERDKCDWERGVKSEKVTILRLSSISISWPTKRVRETQQGERETQHSRFARQTRFGIDTRIIQRHWPVWLVSKLVSLNLFNLSQFLFYCLLHPSQKLLKRLAAVQSATKVVLRSGICPLVPLLRPSLFSRMSFGRRSRSGEKKIIK